MKRKIIASVASATALLSLSVTNVFAHAVVSPKQVGVAATWDFSLSVPSEKDGSTTSVRLVLPPGLNFVTPAVQPGWKIDVKSGPIPSGMQAPVAADGDVADSMPTEIDWTGGTIPAQQKDVFVFQAQVPAKPQELDWKIYQGYSDGSTVSWDQSPNAQQPKDSKGNNDFSQVGPYSITQVVNDLTSNSGSSDAMGIDTQTKSATTDEAEGANVVTNWVAYAALAIAVIALALMLKDKMKPKEPIA